MTNHKGNADTIYIVRMADGASIETIVEDKAREIHAKYAGSILACRPFPTGVKMPWIGDGDYAFIDGVDGPGCTYIPLGLTGWGLDRHDAYKTMLRAIRDHLERQTETVLSSESVPKVT